MITEDQIQQFERDGAIILRDVIGAHWIDRMRTAIDTVMADPGGLSSNMTGEGGGRFYGDFFLWRHNPEFRAFIFESPLAGLAGEMMRSKKVNFFYEQLLVKEPGTAAVTPWHQDLPYWCVGGWQVVSVWVPFDRATPDNGVVTYVKGSHKWGKLYRPRSFGSRPREQDGETAALEEAPDIDGRPQDFEFVTGILEPGDVFVHHARTLHGAPGNATADQRRRALATRWTGADAYFEDRPGNFLRGDKFGWLREFAPAAPGEPMDSDLFPVVIQ
ncbi:phytanoyl-CoA dioxygenase family protein [Sphingomonas sp. G-3-2-10]|uniref:phytanoyl-CoA dioxygenase family protein n=1 Tax=Sphingomonas sp. G-3-2-10 TaxID=2728838 RepID=UPI00146EA28A|nr:phytanoyl-CoA dioxygenase family protein [Sphingomonas sp. G-3-2-10]NML04370.1 phytanoyl-CoA dioxygenase family protein [Sphingomonas sp. G-3-2-10]